MNEITSEEKGLTLEELARRKVAVKAAIAQQQQSVVESFQQIMTPFTGTKSVSNFIGGRILSGFTMFESLLWGYRIFSRIFRLFRRRR